MRVPPPTTNFDGLLVTMTGNQRKAVVQGPRPDDINPRDFEEWLKFQLQRLSMLGLDPDTYIIDI